MAKKKIKKIESSDKAIERKFKDSLNIRYAKEPDIILLSTIKKKILTEIDRRIIRSKKKIQNGKLGFFEDDELERMVRHLKSLRKFITKLK